MAITQWPLPITTQTEITIIKKLGHNMYNAKIIGVGSFMPQKKVTNR